MTTPAAPAAPVPLFVVLLAVALRLFCLVGCGGIAGWNLYAAGWAMATAPYAVVHEHLAVAAAWGAIYLVAELAIIVAEVVDHRQQQQGARR